MGQKLVELYEQTARIASAKGRMRLAMLTGVPSAKAQETPDSPELIAKFQKAIQEIQKESN